MAIIEIAQTLGYHARLLSLSESGIDYQHGVAEVWVPDLGKWVVLDADFNLFYGSPDRPLSATEVRHRLENGITLPSRTGSISPTFPYAGERQLSVERAYRHIEWSFRSDYWSNRYFRGHPNRSDANSLIWLDEATELPFLAFKPTTGDDELANFPVLSYTFVPERYDGANKNLTGRLYVFYPGTRTITLMHERSAEAIELRDAGDYFKVTLPIAKGQNTFTFTVSTHGFSTVRRDFSVFR